MLHASEFPKDFLWGAATSSYQIEGASAKEQRGQHVWDALCRKPGAIYNGHTGEVACDHVGHVTEDIGIMADMGLKAYRFSVSWPRVLPGGVGSVNAPGLDFYSRLVDGLLEHGIQPWATLFHWDFPLSLYEKGGWMNRDSAMWFADYTKVVVAKLSDRVTHWMTINEPQVVAQLGHADGTHAPGIKLPLREQLTVVHNMLRSHGAAVQAIRAGAKKPATIGWAPVGQVSCPATDDPATVEAARAETFKVNKDNLWNNTWFSDPVCLGHYPEDGLKAYEGHLPDIQSGDLELIRQKLDFYGVNIYSGGIIRLRDDKTVEQVQSVAGSPRTSFNWTINGEALRYGPKFIYERYKLPVIITENGMANLDWVDMDGAVHDPQRIDYTRRYLTSLRRAIADGTDVRGYFHWSLLDNFEWAEGYNQRFGMIHVDFQTLKRTPKMSAHWYKRVIETNGASLEEKIAFAPPAERDPAVIVYTNGARKLDSARG